MYIFFYTHKLRCTLPVRNACSQSSRYCCCGPRTLPGRTIRSQPMLSRASHPCFFIIQIAIRVPVLTSIEV